MKTKVEVQIDGQMMEDPGNGFQMEYYSPIFSNIQNVISCRTTTIQFPLTAPNRRVIDNSMAVDSISHFPYVNHGVYMYVNGSVIVWDGIANLEGIKNTINMMLYFGNIKISKLKDRRLRDLPEASTDCIKWDGLQPVTYYPSDKDIFINQMNFSKEFLSFISPQYRHPVVKATYVLKKIFDGVGFTPEYSGKSNELIDSLLVPLVTKSGDSTLVTQGTVNPLTGQFTGFFHYPIDLKNYNMFDYSLWSSLQNVFVNFTDRYHFAVKGNANLSLNVGNFWVEVDSSTDISKVQLIIFKNDKEFLYADWESQEPGSGTGQTRLNFGSNSFDFDLTIEDKISVGASPQQMNNYSFPTFRITTNTTEIVPFGASFPVIPNLPDWSQVEFIQNICHLSGTFIYSDPYTKIVRFVSVDDLYNNKSNAIDLTEKLVYNGYDSMSYKFSGNSRSSYAQNNYIRYAEDVGSEVNGDGVLYVENQTLEESKELLQLSFATSDAFRDTMTGFTEEPGRKGYFDQACIPVYSYEDITVPVQDRVIIYNDKVEPRILRETADEGTGQSVSTFVGLDFNTLVPEYYSKYQEIIRQPKVITVRCQLSPVMLENLDFLKPVFFLQFGNYYAVMKITSSLNGLCILTLLQM